MNMCNFVQIFTNGIDLAETLEETLKVVELSIPTNFFKTKQYV